MAATETVKTHEEIELKKPINIDGTEIKKILMREPTVGDQLFATKSGGSDADQEITLIANLCEVTPADIHKLSLRDYNQVRKALEGFIE